MNALKIVLCAALAVWLIATIFEGDLDDGPDTARSEAAEAVPGADAEPPAAEDAATPDIVETDRDRPAPRKTRSRTYLVAQVVDGDTIDLASGERVRLVGIDTPETGDCHSLAARRRVEQLVLGKQVRLGESDEDHDGYGRLLRYVDVALPDGPSVDVGLRLIREGLAIARYDSRDGYGFHPREPQYVRADRRRPARACAAPEPAPAPQPLVGGGDCMTGYSPCLPVAADLDCADVDGPIAVTGSDPYRLDRDGDGVACEPY